MIGVLTLTLLIAVMLAVVIVLAVLNMLMVGNALFVGLGVVTLSVAFVRLASGLSS